VNTSPSNPTTVDSPGDDPEGRRTGDSAGRQRKGSLSVLETALIPRSASVDDEWAGDPALDERELEELIRAACEAQTAHDKRVDAGGATMTVPGRTPHPALRRGTRLEGGQLCILEALDAGGMGEVYLAWHEILNDEVVVKVSQAPAMEARFRHEIELQNKLGAHPQIVAVKTAGQFEGRSYLMMDYASGVDLGRYVAAHSPLPWQEACAYIRQAAVGLAHAHHRGVVHRDLKPRNLIRTEADESIKILDWGLALRLDQASADEDARLTQSGIILGTPDYIAPEQISNPATVGPASDLYSLGCTLYELLTGHPPFHDHSNKLMAHLESPSPALPPQLGVPEGVERVLRRLLAKRAKDRYGSAREFEEALGEAVRRAEDGRRPRPFVLQHPGLAAGLIGAVATVAAIAVFAQFDRKRADKHPIPTPAPPLPPVMADLQTLVKVDRHGNLLDLRDAVPLRTGDLLWIECRVPRGWRASAFWFDTESRLTELAPIGHEPDGSFERFSYPVDGATTLVGPEGTEFIFVCARPSDAPRLDEVAALFPQARPWPDLADQELILLDRERVAVWTPSKHSVPRGGGPLQASAARELERTVEHLRLALAERFDSVAGVIFPHRDPVPESESDPPAAPLE
jgi:hypothetical protein